MVEPTEPTGAGEGALAWGQGASVLALRTAEIRRVLEGVTLIPMPTRVLGVVGGCLDDREALWVFDAPAVLRDTPARANPIRVLVAEGPQGAFGIAVYESDRTWLGLGLGLALESESGGGRWPELADAPVAAMNAGPNLAPVYSAESLWNAFRGRPQPHGNH